MAPARRHLHRHLGGAVYNVAKAGVIHMTKSIAVALGPHDIRVNCVCPGFITTPIFARSLGMPSQRAQGTVETIAPLFDDLQPIKRTGRPEDIAEAVPWLGSDKASFVTGHALVVDGGATVGTKWEPSTERARMPKQAMARWREDRGFNRRAHPSGPTMLRRRVLVFANSACGVRRDAALAATGEDKDAMTPC